LEHTIELPTIEPAVVTVALTTTALEGVVTVEQEPSTTVNVYTPDAEVAGVEIDGL
jgi:hypothetical protein